MALFSQLCHMFVICIGDMLVALSAGITITLRINDLYDEHVLCQARMEKVMRMCMRVLIWM